MKTLLKELRRIRSRYGKHFTGKDRNSIDTLGDEAERLLPRPVGRPKGTSVDLDRAETLRREGHPWAHIAAELGVTKQAIYTAFRAAGRALPVKRRAAKT